MTSQSNYESLFRQTIEAKSNFGVQRLKNKCKYRNKNVVKYFLKPNILPMNLGKIGKKIIIKKNIVRQKYMSFDI